MRKTLKEFDFARVAFWAVLAMVVFLTGGIFGEKNLPPYRFFAEGYKSADELLEQARQVRHGLVQKIQYPGNGVTLHKTPEAYEGVTLIQGLFPEGVQLQLLDMSGNILQRWPVRLREIWPDPVHIFPPENVPVNDFHYHTQGMWALPDGAVVFNVEGVGTVKMDKCGAVQWTVDRMAHHSVTHNADGSYWIPVREDIRKVPVELMLNGVSRESLAGSLGKYEDLLLLVSAAGVIEREISVLAAVFAGDFAPDLFDAWRINKLDPTHVNDIEVVTTPLANKITGVEAGDLLVSIRNSHLLVIMDRQDGRIKWHKSGPWVRQHDPDITESGMIEVFNNGGDHLWPEYSPGSSVMSLDPASGATKTLYPLDENVKFYSRIQGTHQLLPNGNRLITESMAGRMFEVNEDGDIVWEYVRPYDSSHAVLISSAIRYDRDYFSVGDWSCAG